MSKETNSKFIKGAATLGIAGIIIKFLGAFFRIPLTNLVGADGMTYYGIAYAIYGIFVVLATAGIPVAISKMVSERIAVKNYKGAHKVFKVSFFLLATIGLTSFCLCFFGAGEIARLVSCPESELSIKAISPALFIIPLFSAFRGYFQGRQNMNPTAISEITEQLFRVVVGLSLSFIFIKKGLEEAAAGATFGASAGSIAGLTVIGIIYFLNRSTIHYKIRNNPSEEESTRFIIKKVLLIAVPIVIGAEIMPIMTAIDTSIVLTRLQVTGWTYAEAKELYGQLSGFCNPLIAFPQVFTQAVAISLVPAISGFFRTKDMLKLQENVKLGLRTTLIMGFPCALGLFALGKPILILLYPFQSASAISAAPTLMIMAISVIFLAIAQTTTGILQGIGKQTLPVRNLFVGAIAKVILAYILVGIPAINIKGTAISTMIAYIITLLLNLRAVKKYTGTVFDFNLTYIRPGISSVMMAAVAFGVYRLFNGFAGNTIATGVAIIIGVIVYVIMIFFTKAITKEELIKFPKGDKLVRIFDRFSR